MLKWNDPVQYTERCFGLRYVDKKPTNCGTKAADVLAKFFTRETLMRIHLIFWCSCNNYDFTTPFNSKCFSMCFLLGVI